MMCTVRKLLFVTALLAAEGRAEQAFDSVPYGKRFVLPCATVLCQDNHVVNGAELVHDGAASRDRAGLRRDTWYFLGYQVVAIGILYAAPESLSGWSEEQRENYSLSEWRDNITHPAWDEDDHVINYVLHPYWGAAYYVRARERGYSRMHSFWYSSLLSTAYEFGAEALFERPSIQDLIVTPVGGTLLGNYFMKVRAGVRAREDELGYRRTADKWLWVLTDPLGSINQQLDRLFNRDTTLHVRPFVSEIRHREPGAPASGPSFETEPVVGIWFHVSW